MGQYYKGEKIGTCESMYYMRLETAKELAERGECDDDGIAFKSYLSDNVTRFRFPFPDEDGGIKADCKYDKGFDLPAASITVDHDRLCFHNTHANGGYGINVFIPCPHSKEFKDQGIGISNGGAGEQFVTVRFQAIRNGEEKTIFACARCGKQQCFDTSQITVIKERATEYFEAYKPRTNDPKSGNKGLYNYANKVIALIK